MTSIDQAVRDLNQIEADIRNAGAVAGARASLLVRKTALDIVATAKTFVPVDTGLTRETISADFSDDGLRAEIGPTTEYAPYLESGTSRMAPHAFMGPAFDRHIPDFVDGVKQFGGEIL